MRWVFDFGPQNSNLERMFRRNSFRGTRTRSPLIKWRENEPKRRGLSTNRSKATARGPDSGDGFSILNRGSQFPSQGYFKKKRNRGYQVRGRTEEKREGMVGKGNRMAELRRGEQGKVSGLQGGGIYGRRRRPKKLLKIAGGGAVGRHGISR